MGYIIINRDDEEMGGMRSNMRRMMRGDYRYEGSEPMMRHDEHEKEKMYEMGFRHGWEDSEDEHYRRARDSRGRYV